MILEIKALYLKHYSFYVPVETLERIVRIIILIRSALMRYHECETKTYVQADESTKVGKHCLANIVEHDAKIAP